MNLQQLADRFRTEDDARAYLEQIRWPNGVKCLRCGHDKISRLHRQHKYECAKCEYQFSVTVGTIFHRTHISLRKWLIVIYLMGESKKGISACQIKRTIGVSYPTAWYMCHRIRNAMRTTGTSDKLEGILEIDEVYVGGKAKQVGRPGRLSNKTPVMGIVERGGRVKCVAMPDLGVNNVFEFIRRSINQDAVKVIYSDEWKGYKMLKWYVPHQTINHSVTYSVGVIHTNTIESFWSLLKRGVIGAFHKVSVKHLHRYLDEFSFRFNGRENRNMLDLILKNCEKRHISFCELVI